MGQAFYRKYRSKTLDEVIGQNHITTILKNVLRDGNLSHAYLFTGPRGVGKTSIARILSKEVNGLTPDDKNFYPDIIEIDAASNRRIEEIRELRDKISTAPSQLKYKIYIIDEVHMLTREAFNALLKTLEEPPAHAIFILATTDFHKVPDTIISRCMRLNFKALTETDMIEGLKAVAKKEKIDFENEALELIAEFSEGSFRDALSLLDQMNSAGKKIDTALVELSLGIANPQSISELIRAIKASNTQEIFDQIQAMIDGGATPDQINKQLSKALRGSLLGSEDQIIASHQAIDLIENLNQMYSYQEPRLALELAILKVIDPKPSALTKVEPAKAPEAEPVDIPVASQPDLTQSVKQKTEQAYVNGEKLWLETLSTLKDRNNTLYGIARMAEPVFEKDQLILFFKFPFHFKQVNIQKNKNLIEQILSELSSDTKLVIAITGDKPSEVKAETELTDEKNPDDLKSISNIFGSAEVLES